MSFKSERQPKGRMQPPGTDPAFEPPLTGAASGLPDDGDLRPPIADSWQRSVACGIDYGRTEAPSAEEADGLCRLRRANKQLLKAAGGVVNRIGRMLNDAEAMLILTDSRGVVVEAVGDPRTIRAAREINLYTGGHWHEAAVGTNGIGTALFAGRPMFVHGEEHFVERLRKWSCAAAPIRDPLDHEVIGAVDLSGLTKIFRRHNTAFAAAAAGEIEAALAEAAQQERARLIEVLAHTAPSAAREAPVLILDRRGRLIHRTGRAGHDGLDHLAPGQRIVEITGEQPTADAVAAALPESFAHRAVEVLTVDGRPRGFAVILGERSSPGGSTATVSAGGRRRQQSPDPAIVAESEPMLDAIELARRAARLNAPVLVEGETGTGKELFARLIHREAARGRDTPFVAINCGAISRDLVGGELFGHVEGAFTGALKDGRPGKLELASGGVFCLDEIGEMPLEIQPYLLRVLEERVVHRIGDSRGRPFDARLVALTNRDLKAEAEAGRFRLDLYYRIGAITVRVPPLRDREGDALLLLDYFNHKIAEENGLPPLRIGDEARARFLAYQWPGNVRELRNLVQRLFSLSRDGRIGLGDLPAEMRVDAPAAPAESPGSLSEAEKAAVLRAIKDHGGNLSKAAEALGVSRPTLYRKMRAYDIQRVFR